MGNHEYAKRMGASIADTVGIKLRAEILMLAPEQITPDPNQPRREFNPAGLSRLAESLRKYGQLQPVLVRKEGAKYVLVAGERRWRAAKEAGMRTIQALHCRGGDVKCIQLVENLLREDLKPIEQARAYEEIMKREKWSARELARQLSLDHTAIAKARALLGLPEQVQADVDAGKIPPTTAYEISKRPKSEHKKLGKEAAAGRIKGDDLRRKSAPAPAPAPVLTLGASPPWTHRVGKVQITVTGHVDHRDVVAALEGALNAARSGKMPLVGGLGQR